MIASYRSFFKKLLAKSKPKYLQPVEVMGDLYGYAFPCPGCSARHFIPTKVSDAEGRRWAFNDDFEKPSFTPAIRSVIEHENAPSEVCCVWISKGRLDFTDECTHKLRGKIVDMINFS